eukprot:TRINITY_DN284_c3_g1_i1.p1 TRINITY_DN284_c3_g1~~TRINITY_DN284_c3_g1_i1.p1  ORF type:complete len:2297 (+),score=617.95 TRINITY_DN284_c3_g1_i1:955-6891(+)
MRRVQLATKKWYFLVITHLYHMVRKSEACFYMDGKLIETVPLLFPKSDVMTYCYLGTNRAQADANGRLNQLRPQPLSGQLGQVFLLQGIAEECDVRAAFNMGPNIMPNRSEVGHNGAEFDFTPKRNLKIIFAYHPQAFNGVSCYETSTGLPERFATRLPGTTLVTCLPLHLAFHRAGGAKLLLPLFKQIDLPSAPSPYDLTKDDGQADVQKTQQAQQQQQQNAQQAASLFGKDVETPLTQSLSHLLCLFGSVVSKHLDDLFTPDIFQSLSYALSQLSPAVWNKTTLGNLEDLEKIFAKNANLSKHFIHQVYLNFDMWIYCSVPVQLQILTILSNRSKDQPEFFREVIGVQRIVEILRFYYWFKPEVNVSRCLKPLVKDNQVIAERPPVADIRQLRQVLLRAVGLFTKNQLAFEEIKCLTSYLHDCKDDDQCIDVTQFLLFVLANFQSPMWADVLKLNFVFPLLELMKRKDTNLRLWVLKFICFLMKVAKQGGANKTALLSWLSSLKMILQSHPLTKPTYNTLLELLFDMLSPTASPITVTKELAFKFSEVLPVIFELVCVASHPVLQRTVLLDFYLLLSQNDGNRATFLSFPHWQAWLLGLLAMKSGAELWQKGYEIYDYVVKIFTTLFHHMLQMKNGSGGIVDSFALLQHFSENGFANADKFATAVNQSLLTLLESDADLPKKMHEHYYLAGNVYSWAALAGVLLFPQKPSGAADGGEQPLHFVAADITSPDHFLKHISRNPADRTWEDFHFAQKLLHFLEVMLNQAPLVPRSVAASPPNPFGAQSSPSPPPVAPLPVGPAPPPVAPLWPSQAQTQAQTQPTQSAGSICSGVGSCDKETGNLVLLLDALFLRLTLTSLYETDLFLNTQRTQKRQDDLKKLELLAKNSFITGSRGCESFLQYLRSKTKGFSSELGLVDSTLSANIQRLRKIVDGYLVREDPRGELMQIIAFLFKAMKASYDHQGRGAEMMLAIFREIITLSKTKFGLVLPPEYGKDDTLVQLFMSHFYHEPSPHLRFLDAEMLRIIRAEELQFFNQHARVQDDKNTLTRAIATFISEEHQAQANIDEEIIQQSHAISAELSAKILATHNTHSRSTITKRRMWRELLHSLWPNTTEHWRLDAMENKQRMRRRLQANWAFDAHRDKVAFTRAEIVGAAPAPVAAGPSADTTIAVPLAAASASTEDLPEDPHEPILEEEVLPDASGKGVKCEMIEPMRATPGILEITAKRIRFIPSTDTEGTVDNIQANDTVMERAWPLSNLENMYTRRYVLRDTGIELFFHDRATAFFNFPKNGVRDGVYYKISTFQSPLIGGIASMITKPSTPENVLKKSGLTELWVNRKISNFDYLMGLNTIAGRSYNDLSQYPIFPWVVADYTSAELDLTNSASFRDLSKPMGALHPERLADVMARYESFNDPEIPKFHYGTHYSTLGAVLHYLIRLEPFTTYFLEFQGGKFDHPNRMFTSVRQSWAGAAVDASSVKELIPEFFYLPEFLVNSNQFNFGLPVRDPVAPDANGLVPKTVGDVDLPPWAHGSPYVFVQKNREALESDYVSEHLNEWIDLIFGCKQRGKAAEESYNVFYYLTYEGMVNVDKIADQQQRSAIISQIYNFGQTPSQLFTKSHPKRVSAREALDKTLAQIRPASGAMPYSYTVAIPGYSSPLVSILPVQKQHIVTVASDGTMGMSIFSDSPDAKGYPFTFEVDKTLSASMRQKTVETLYAPEVLARGAIAASKDAKFIVTCGDWDNRFQIRAPNAKSVRSVFYGSDVITCVAMDKDYLVVGSRDSTIALYRITKNPLKVKPKTPEDPLNVPTKVLYGHTGSVQCLCVSEDFDTVVSASHGTGPQCLVHSLRSGILVRTLPVCLPVFSICVTSQGCIAVLCSSKDKFFLSVFNINGTLLAQSQVDGVTVLVASPDGSYLLTANVTSGCTLRSVHDLSVVRQFETDSPITAISFVGEGTFVMLGLANGTISFFSFVPELWKQQQK